MFAEYVTRGVKAGVVAGLAFGLLVALVANPLVGYADELGHGASAADHGHEGADGHAEAESGNHDEGEDHASDGHHDAAGPLSVGNAVSVVSGVLWAVLLGGGVFGVAYYFLEPAIPGTGATKSYVLALAGFVTVSGAPWLVLPPQPPGVEQSLPVRTRLLLYGGMMVAGALACLLAGFAYARLRPTRGRAVAVLGAVLPVALLAAVAVAAPTNAAESALPAELATGLTGMVVFGQALLWALLAGVHARLRDRTADDSRRIDASPGPGTTTVEP